MKTLKKIPFSPISRIESAILKEKSISLSILREDLNDIDIQGNKFRKLYYNLLNSKKKGNTTLVTFGGAYSNHILAVAQAGSKFGFKTIGIIRGEETFPLNTTLSVCKELGMEFHYVNRELYKLKNSQDFKDYLRNEYGAFYLIPEGGTNYYAVNGCMEIIENYNQYDFICCPMGTGGTIAGITIANNNSTNILGFPALKGGEFLKADTFNHMQSVVNNEEDTEELIKSLTLVCDFHFGGYAKINEDLINFVRKFNQDHQIKWDLIYNGKMAYGVFELIKNNYFPEGSKILLVHTGGNQGIKGIEERYKVKIYED